MNKHNEFIRRATAVLQRLATVQGDIAHAMRVMAKEGDEFSFLPWRIKDGSPRDIVDCNGVPVCFSSSTTSVRGSGREETSLGGFKSFTDYNTTETVGPIRAALIVEAVNAFFGDGHVD